VKRVALLDLAKLQMMRFRQGDMRHFSCRYMQVQDEGRFNAGFDPFCIGNVVGQASADHNDYPVLCRNSPSVTVMKMIYLFGDLFRRVEHHRAYRRKLWRATLMEYAATVHARNGPSYKPILHLNDEKEWGVILHDDAERCRDDGNLFLWQVFANHLVLAEETLGQPQ
jgi:hypothetical protein